ncbi:MAG: hypothetical protein ACT4OO_10675 [Nitrospiraceae bacterium]
MSGDPFQDIFQWISDDAAAMHSAILLTAEQPGILQDTQKVRVELRTVLAAGLCGPHLLGKLRRSNPPVQFTTET